MIVAFDGNVFVGKTTLINHLSSQMKCQLIPEHSFFVNKIEERKKYSPELAEHLRYLRVDHQRIKMIKKGVNLLDRSFISLSAHVYALYASFGVDLRERHLAILKRFLFEKKIIVPDFYVFVYCEWKVARKRFLNNVYDDRGTPDVFFSKKYFSGVEKFNLLWQNELCNNFITMSKKTDQYKLAEIIIKFAKNNKSKMSSTSIIYSTEKIFFK